jgi:hypothetical protein
MEFVAAQSSSLAFDCETTIFFMEEPIKCTAGHVSPNCHDLGNYDIVFHADVFVNHNGVLEISEIGGQNVPSHA